MTIVPHSRDKGPTGAFDVSFSEHLFGTLVHRWPRGAAMLGDLETWIVRERLESVKIEQPVFVAGMARSGLSIVTDVLADQAHVSTLRSRDHLGVFTPYWYQEVFRRGSRSSVPAAVQQCGFGFSAVANSPGGSEEPLWAAFFPQTHSVRRSQILDARTTHPAFERFYRNHLRKLLASCGGKRYVSKGNYNVTRLQYLLSLFPDARFIIPVRHPRHHIASLMKQHELFVAGQTKYPRSRDYLRRMGHFEFGLDRRAINMGDTRTTVSVQELWQRGEEVRGWARYWANLYGWVADQLDADPVLRQAAILVRYEDLCDRPQQTLTRILRHAGLDDGRSAALHAGWIHTPNYCQPNFSFEDERAILEETRTVARRYRYNEQPSVLSISDFAEAVH